MKTKMLLLLFATPLFGYSQKITIQKVPKNHPVYQPAFENWLDTSNMYQSRYGSVARLTQDNMPCIMPNHPVQPIPNATDRNTLPGGIPNLWKNKPKEREQPGRRDSLLPTQAEIMQSPTSKIRENPLLTPPIHTIQTDISISKPPK